MIDEHELAKLAAANPEPRQLTALVLDNSGSMAGRPLEALNAALPLLKSELLDDTLARKRAEVAIVALSPQPAVLASFAPITAFEAPRLAAAALTPLGAGVALALASLRERMAALRQEGVRLYRGNLLILTDGDATDDTTASADACRAAEQRGEINVFPIGIGPEALTALAGFSASNSPAPLEGLRFRELIQWVTLTMRAQTQSASHSAGVPTERVPLPPTNGWMAA